MISFAIDGRPVTAREGETVLDVARAAGIFIPALCYHKAVSHYGSCRLCLVEVEKRGRRRIVASCSYLAEDGLVVDTQAPGAVKARNVAMELLLARCPENPAVRAMAGRMGVRSTRFALREEDCILCGLCVRVCREVIGADCLAFSGRGSERRVTTPYDKPARECIGCGACAAVCPTGAIRLRAEGGTTILPEWQTVLSRIRCPECGRHFASYPQLDHVKAKLEWDADLLELCPDCRRRRFSRQAVEEQVRRREV